MFFGDAFFQKGVTKINDKIEKRRKATFFYPTLSDKSTMMLITALTRQVGIAEGKLDKASQEMLYKALVLPEIHRMKGKIPQNMNPKEFKADAFYFLRSLNDLEINGENLITIINNSATRIYEDTEVKEAILEEISNVFDTLLTEKLEDWERFGIGQTSTPESAVKKNYSFIDANYIKAIKQAFPHLKKSEQIVEYAAADFIFNSLIANAEITKLFIGDPAQYYKESSKDNATIQDHLEETYINIGKRLAGDIAPGIQLAVDNKNPDYIQVFFQDQKIDSNNVKNSAQAEYFSKIDKEYKKNYSGINGSDAQEYTTWREHIYVLKQLGRLTTKQYNTITKTLEEGKKLSYEEVGLVLQPLKPVYVGNVVDVKNNIDRRVYIKSSSFPLIPQLTKGLEIDKIRVALENFQENKTKENPGKRFVRASFGTANKVGSVASSLKVFNPNGSVIDNLKVEAKHTLVLPRKNFRIQQDVPYDRAKDVTNIGTQQRKLLFVDFLDLQIEKGVTGADLKQRYEQLFGELFEDAQNKLAEELGMFTLEKGDLNIEQLLAIPETSIFEEPSEEGERVQYINDNFDNIVEQLIKSKVNVFFKDEEDNHKNCEE
jgi:hypothetical protein